MNKIFSFLLAVSAFFILSCAKAPGEIKSPGIKIEAGEKSADGSFHLRVSGGIKNENSATALLDFKGKINFIDPADKGKVVMSLPFRIPAVLPFDTAVFDQAVSKSAAEMEPLLLLLQINREELKKNGSVEKFNILSRYIQMDDVSYKTKGIISLLKEKINEKN